MEMNAQAKCDLNHFGYGLRPLEAWEIVFFLRASFLSHLSLFLSPLNVM